MHTYKSRSTASTGACALGALGSGQRPWHEASGLIGGVWEATSVSRRSREGGGWDKMKEQAEEGWGKMKELRGRLVDYACHHRKHGHDALLLMLAGFAFVSCLLLLLPNSPFSAAMDDLLQLGRTRRCDQEMAPTQPAPCAGVANGTLCCDRSSPRADVCVMLEYHDWWMTKYGHIVEQLSDFPPIDFSNDTRTHCFPKAVVCLRIHDELAIDASRMLGNQGILDFRQILDDAYRGRIKAIIEEEKAAPQAAPAAAEAKKRQPRSGTEELVDDKPRLVIVSRNGSRAIENEAELARAAARAVFRVTVLRPRPDTELAQMYRVLNGSDVMVGVHGAAMTFMRPGSAFIQVVPLGTDWAAENYYGEPARRLGLRYMGSGKENPYR